MHYSGCMRAKSKLTQDQLGGQRVSQTQAVSSGPAKTFVTAASFCMLINNQRSSQGLTKPLAFQRMESMHIYVFIGQFQQR